MVILLTDGGHFKGLGKWLPISYFVIMFTKVKRIWSFFFQMTNTQETDLSCMFELGRFSADLYNYRLTEATAISRLSILPGS